MLGFGYPLEHAQGAPFNWVTITAAVIVALIVVYSIFEQSWSLRRQRRREVPTEVLREERKAA